MQTSRTFIAIFASSFVLAALVACSSSDEGAPDTTSSSSTSSSSSGGSSSGASSTSSSSSSSGSSGASSSGSSGSSGNDGAADTGSDAPQGDGGACNNTVTVEGPMIDQVVSHAPAPTATGGGLLDGRYVLTKSTYHTSKFTDGMKLNTVGRITLVIAAGQLEGNWTDDVGDVTRHAGPVSTNGTGYTFTSSCVGTGASYFGGAGANVTYTWDGTNLSLVIPSPIAAGDVLVNVYAKK